MIKSLFASTAKGIGSIGLKVVIVSAATIGGAALVSSSVFASLTATATNPAQSVQTGTLKLTQVSSTSPASGGITTTISGMAPGDTVNRYIELTNGGTLDAASMTLGLADSASTALTTNGTAGLQVVVNACTLAWSAAGVCTGTTTAMMSTKTALLMTGTPQTLALPAGATTAASITHLQISLSLPAGSEVTINGVLPTGTVQGLTSSLVWTFTETERTTTTTNS
jgi:spore coat-associated protein N